MWDLTNEECHGDIQTLIEMDREANAEQDSTSANGGRYSGDMISLTAEPCVADPAQITDGWPA
jgi:hypothetical protein